MYSTSYFRLNLIMWLQYISFVHVYKSSNTCQSLNKLICIQPPKLQRTLSLIANGSQVTNLLKTLVPKIIRYDLTRYMQQEWWLLLILIPNNKNYNECIIIRVTRIKIVPHHLRKRSHNLIKINLILHKPLRIVPLHFKNFEFGSPNSTYVNKMQMPIRLSEISGPSFTTTFNKPRHFLDSLSFNIIIQSRPRWRNPMNCTVTIHAIIEHYIKWSNKGRPRSPPSSSLGGIYFDLVIVHRNISAPNTDNLVVRWLRRLES